MFGIRKHLGRKKDRDRTGPVAREVLRRISDEQMAVRMELERLLMRFNTRLLLRERTVLVGKPPGLDETLAEGDAVRFKVPWAREYEVLMRISSTHMDLADSQAGFVCKAPAGHALPLKRATERFSTKEYSNVQLVLPSFGLDFPIVDLSSSGCRIQARRDILGDLFRLHQTILDGVIQVGERFHITLESLIPRVHLGDMAGLEIHTADGAGPRRNLSTLLGTLAMQEVRPQAPHPAP